MKEIKQLAVSEKNTATPIRTYKDRVFRMIFKDKGKLLELYNAINGTNYQNSEDLVVTTLENAIYMSLKNDMSFLLYDYLSLYEHQSTKNPNMPLRNLFYISEVYANLTKHNNLYGSKLVQIPAPRFVVFYNGADSIPEKTEQKLSEAYLHFENEPELELRTTVLNINLGCNKGLAEKCRPLWEYMMFVAKIRKYRKEYSLIQAVEFTIDECIKEGILKEFLEKSRAEVKKVSIYEYDEEKHIRMEREDAWAEGRAEGRIEGRKETLIHKICLKLEKAKTPEAIAEELEEDLAVVKEIVRAAEEWMPVCSKEELSEKILEYGILK